MSKRRRITVVNGGISLILLLFILMSLICFATLSIASARADEKLAEKYREQNDGYYQARNEAQARLEEIDSELEALYASGLPQSSYFAAAGDRVLTERFPAGKNFDLVLTLEVLYPASEQGPFYRVLSEKTESTVTYEYDDTLSVLQ